MKAGCASPARPQACRSRLLHPVACRSLQALRAVCKSRPAHQPVFRSLLAPPVAVCKNPRVRVSR